MAEIVYESPAGTFEAIVFDVTVREAHEEAADIPSHPVEAAADQNDHVRRHPRRLTLEVGVTNTPIRVPVSEYTGEPIPDVVASVQSMAVQAISQRMTKGASVKGSTGVTLPLPLGVPATIGASPFSVDNATWDLERSDLSATVLVVEPMDRVRAVFALLRTLWGKPLTVLTSVDQYDSMALARIGAPVDHVGYIQFQLDFETFNLAETQTIQPDPLEPRGQNLNRNGAQAGYELPETQQSGARQAMEAIQGFLQRDTVAAL